MLIILQLAILFVFAAVALRVLTKVALNSAIYAEFHQSRWLAPLSLLFPVGPIAILATQRSVLIAVAAAAGCYPPALVLSRRQIGAFERSGTDRVRDALNTAHLAWAASVAGLIYVAGVVGLGLAFSKL